MNLRRYFFTLLVVLPLSSPLSAQETDEDDKFYLDFAGSAVFPYNPKGQFGHGVKAGAGFTAAFGYAFKEGFSTEIEWGHQKVGVGNPTVNLFPVTIPFLSFGPPLLPPINIEIDGEIKTQSLMGNFYYRYPKWRVSPYAGFGLGAFFHDGALTRTVTFEYDALPPVVIGPGDIITGVLTGVRSTPVAYEDSRFAYQIMVGLSADIYTITASLAGIPGVSVPCGNSSEGLPIGMQILTSHFEEAKMLKLAAAFERAGGFEG